MSPVMTVRCCATSSPATTRHRRSGRIWLIVHELTKAWLADQGRGSRIHHKQPPGRAMLQRIARSNARKPAVRARPSKHVFAHQKQHMGLFVRTIGLPRATTKIGLVNLVTTSSVLSSISTGRPRPDFRPHGHQTIRGTSNSTLYSP